MFPFVKDFKWHLTNSGYVRTGGYKVRCVLLHKMLFKTPKGLYIDHINGNIYRAYIKVNQKQMFGGDFKTEEEAVNARIILEQKYFKEYSRCVR